jgi:hypothetical protein
VGVDEVDLDELGGARMFLFILLFLIDLAFFDLIYFLTYFFKKTPP